MKIIEQINWPKPGKYIIAVSGGVDSVMLLHLLNNLSLVKPKLVVAHADHGWRPESNSDVEFVRKLAESYDLPFESVVLKLAGRSEAEARKARYEFFESVRKKHNALAIITAHHLNDRIETALFNIMRGTNIYGIAALRSTAALVRPLLGISKQDIIQYAKKHDLEWREDSSNQDLVYARNKIRHELIPILEDKNSNFTQEFNEVILEAEQLSDEITKLVHALIKTHGAVSAYYVELPMHLIRALQLPVLRHVLVIAVRMVSVGAQLDLLTINQAALHLKTGRVKRLRKLNNQLNLAVQDGKVIITAHE